MSELSEITSAEKNSTPTVNVFQFMMNNRHKVIGSNSPGKECKDIILPNEIEKNREKLNKRKSLFEHWAKKKGSEEYKIMDEVAEKYIHRTLKNRKKRMKQMLKIVNEELKNSVPENSDSDDEIIKIKAKKVKVFSDSENSNNADDIKYANKNNSFREELEKSVQIENKENDKVKTQHNDVNLSENKIKSSNKLSLKNSDNLKKIKSNEILKNSSDDLTDDEIFSIKFKENVINDKEQKKKCFSPRTWRMKVKLSENVSAETINENDESEEIIEIDNSFDKEIQTSITRYESKKALKLAPVFTQRLQKKLNKEALTAKDIFLRSGMPSQVKEFMSRSKSFEDQDFYVITFPKINHVQQRTDNKFWHLSKTDLNFSEFKLQETIELPNKITLGTLSEYKSVVSLNHCNSMVQENHESIKQIVKNLKKTNSAYPVYKTFRILYEKSKKNILKTKLKIENPPETLKRKRGRSKKREFTESQYDIRTNEILPWTEKYKPESSGEIFGNTKAIKELKQWLESWISYRASNKKKKRICSSSSDDFYSDSTTEDKEIFLQNVVLLVGPLGSGKTSSVYALCNELNLDIFEINASSKRPGKKILADHQKGIQSHYVQNTENKIENEDDINKKLSVLLIEDVDIIFEDQDEGFFSAITTLVTSSKRPIILTTTDKYSPHLQKFILQYTVINFHSLTNKILTPWLQIVCLVEGLKVNKDMIDTLVIFFKGDFRKIMLQLQFWVQTGGDLHNFVINSQTSQMKNSIRNCEVSARTEVFEDDNSNLSWLSEQENCEDNDGGLYHEKCLELFIPYYKKNNEFNLAYPVHLDAVWLNISDAIIENSKTIETKGLDNISSFLEILTEADTIYSKLKLEYYEELHFNYWQKSPEHNLSLNENFMNYEETNITSLEIVHSLIEFKLKYQNSSKNNTNWNIFLAQNNELDMRLQKHKTMKELLNAVPAFCILDRRAICEDYQAILREINRNENQNLVTNNKRKNRFYHYLKNFNIHLNDSTNIVLCNTLSTN